MNFVLISLLSSSCLFHSICAINVTLIDGSTFLGDVDVNELPNGFGKQIKSNGDIFE